MRERVMNNRTALAVAVFLVWAASLLAAATMQSTQELNDKIYASPSVDESSAPGPTDPPGPSIAPGQPNTPAQGPLTPGPSTPPPAPPPPPPPPPKPVKLAGAPCVTTVSACVQLSTKRAWLISDGKVILGPVPITSGKSRERTPAGMHQVLWKDKDHKSKEFDDAPMPWSVFFADGGIAFHTGSLRAQSSGCVHLSNSIAKRFFNFLQVGDSVQVLK